MKTRLLIAVSALLLFSSCIVKSLQPFYKKEQLNFDTRLIGKWIDHREGTWEFVSFKTEWKKENKEPTKLMKEDREAYENYKDGYVMTYIEHGKEANFIAMPFKVGKAVYLDVMPFIYDTDKINDLISQHLLKTHSVARVDFSNDKPIALKWLPESTITSLFEQEKLRLKFEKSGIDQDLVLTDDTEALNAFLHKFEKFKENNKWENDTTYKLSPQTSK
ncbi:hypothetical protein Q2T40_11415 [Winogradskyella maritima]|uniref:Lipoprotein n=1 Tax=Winogradskyella maritima TaxID=1517766 RepID=A0ABV8AHW4_9FLAO|nr:hypothetical protein [Winogradskyella maritima]